MKEKAVLLLGSYGQTNLGDDLLMWNYLNLLRERGFNKIYVNASSKKNIPAVIKKEFPDLLVKQTYKTSLIDWLRLIARVDCIVYGGGTIFKELYSSTGRGKYSVIARIMIFNLAARLFGKDIYNLHIGIGVLRTGVGRAITRLALRASKLTIFRDKKSYMIARESLGQGEDKVCLATDGLFINDRWQKLWNKAEWRPHGKHKKVVGINLLSDIPDWIDRNEYIRIVKEFVDYLLAQGDLVVLMPFQHAFNPNNDHKFMKSEVASHFIDSKNVVLLDEIPIDQAVSIFKSLDIFVGMRFHSLLLATCANTPFIGLAYDTKCWRFIQDSNYAYGLKLEDINPEKLQQMYHDLLHNIVQVPETLQKITATQRKNGEQCLKNLNF